MDFGSAATKVAAAARSGGVGGAWEAVGSARGGATGILESGNKLGMFLVMFLPICTATGDS